MKFSGASPRKDFAFRKLYDTRSALTMTSRGVTRTRDGEREGTSKGRGSESGIRWFPEISRGWRLAPILLANKMNEPACLLPQDEVDRAEICSNRAKG